MTLYKQQDMPVDGTVTKYTRAELMCLYNNEIPRVECSLQYHLDRLDVLVHDTPGEKLIYEMTNPSVMIPLIDPNTYEETAVRFPAGQFALMAASVYMWMARNRDAVLDKTS